MKKLIFTMLLALVASFSLCLTSCTSKTDIVNKMVEESKSELAKYNQQDLKIDVRNENDDYVMELSTPVKFSAEDMEKVNNISDTEMAAAAKQNLKTEQIKILKDNDIKIRYIFKDADGQKIEKVINPALL